MFKVQHNNNVSPVYWCVTFTNGWTESDCGAVISRVHRLMMLIDGITSDLDPFELCFQSKVSSFTTYQQISIREPQLHINPNPNAHRWSFAELQSVGVKMKMRLELFLLVTMVICAAGKPPNKAAARNKLLLISFDGFRWDYDQDVDTPHLDQLLEDGVKAKYITPPMLTMTGPSHFTTITGNTNLLHSNNNNDDNNTYCCYYYYYYYYLLKFHLLHSFYY